MQPPVHGNWFPAESVTSAHCTDGDVGGGGGGGGGAVTIGAALWTVVGIGATVVVAATVVVVGCGFLVAGGAVTSAVLVV